MHIGFLDPGGSGEKCSLLYTNMYDVNLASPEICINHYSRIHHRKAVLASSYMCMMCIL